MITDRDRRIILHLERYKYATIEQLEKIFFRRQKNSYNIARRRMVEITKAGYAKVKKHPELANRVVYIYNESKIPFPDRHRMIVLDVLANIHHCGFEVQEFSIEKRWMGDQIKSDAFTVFAIDTGKVDSRGNSIKRRRSFFIEVELSNNPHRLEKYEKLLETDEVARHLGSNTPPVILLVSDKDYGNISLDHVDVIQLNTSLDPFASIILPPIRIA